MQITFKYCPSCGKENKETNNDFSRNRDKLALNAAVSNHSTNNNKNNAETSGNSRANFKAIMTQKNEERTSHFKPAKKQRLSSMQEVTINIGQMEFNEEGLASPLRGKSLPVKIAKDADYKTLLEAALKKRRENIAIVIFSVRMESVILCFVSKNILISSYVNPLLK